MARTVNDVLIGTGALYSKASTGTYSGFPDPPEGSIDGATAPTAFTEMGYSDEGWSFNVDRTFEDILVAEENDPIKILKTAQNLVLVGILAQATLESIQLAMGGGTITGADPAGFDSYVPPATTDAADELALILAVPASPVATVAKVRYFEIPRAIATGAYALQHAKAPNRTVVAVEFRLILPTDGSEIFTIREQIS